MLEENNVISTECSGCIYFMKEICPGMVVRDTKECYKRQKSFNIPKATETPEEWEASLDKRQLFAACCSCWYHYTMECKGLTIVEYSPTKCEELAKKIESFVKATEELE